MVLPSEVFLVFESDFFFGTSNIYDTDRSLATSVSDSRTSLTWALGFIIQRGLCVSGHEVLALFLGSSRMYQPRRPGKPYTDRASDSQGG